MTNNPVKTQQYIRYALTACLVVFYLLLFYFLRDRITNPAALVASLETLYKEYGYLLVFLGGLAEGIFLVGMYIPGSTVILLGAALAGSNTLSLPYVIFTGVSGLVSGYTINYLLGKYGWYKLLANTSMMEYLEHAKAKVLAYETKAYIMGFSSPFLATFLTTSAGMMQLPFKKFILRTTVIQLSWTTIYASLAYIFGLQFIEIFIRYFGIVMFVLILISARKIFFKRGG